MNFQKNEFGGYTLQSDLFKDFWFLKCLLVGREVNADGEFFINEKLLSQLQVASRSQIGSYDKDQHTIELRLDYHDPVNPVIHTTIFNIDLTTGDVDIKILPLIIRTNYTPSPDMPFATKEWIFDNAELRESDNDYFIIKRSSEYLITDVIYNRHRKEWGKWLDWLSKLKRTPDETMPPCSVECPHKHMMSVAGIEYCEKRLYKIL